MAKRWLNSADVEISEAGAILTQSDAPSTLAGGTKIVAAAATPEVLVAVSTPCRSVWIGARVDANGAAQNTKPAFIGNSAGQNIPVMPSNFEGFVVRIDDASKLYVKVGVNGEGVAYRIVA